MQTVFRIELNLFGTFLIGIIIWLFYKQIKKQTVENKVFLRLCRITLFELILDSAFWLVDGAYFCMAPLVNILINTMYYFFQILSCYLWMNYCNIHMEVKVRKWLQYLFNGILVFDVSLLIINLWNGCVFSVDGYNIYRRSWGIWGSMEAVCCLFYPLVCIILTVWKMMVGEQKQRRDGGYLLIVSIVPIVSTVIQMIFYGLNFIWVGMAMALLLVLIERVSKQYQEMTQQLTDQRIKIMLSQIQPHFLYNSLTAISYLCDVDPKQAKEATVAFSKYLRVNIDSIKQTNPVPFETELNHIKIYLSLEKMRFEDELEVVYDIKAKGFLVPALTIQPLVENAVKYGVGQKENGGTIYFSTEEREDYFVIIIEDDGVGFTPYETQYDGRSHIGIDNVKARLEGMCEGKLEIQSEIGKGTKVSVYIPKQGGVDEDH